MGELSTMKPADILRTSEKGVPTPYRVFCLRNVVTPDGDLIIAGTPGTLYHWFMAEDGKEQVMVRWDHYLFAEDPDELCERANTHIGLAVPVAIDELRWLRER